jgi:hypothetical protein
MRTFDIKHYFVLVIVLRFNEMYAARLILNDVALLGRMSLALQLMIQGLKCRW